MLQKNDKFIGYYRSYATSIAKPKDKNLLHFEGLPNNSALQHTAWDGFNHGPIVRLRSSLNMDLDGLIGCMGSLCSPQYEAKLIRNVNFFCVMFFFCDIFSLYVCFWFFFVYVFFLFISKKQTNS